VSGGILVMYDLYSKNQNLSFSLSYAILKETHPSLQLTDTLLTHCLSLLELTPSLDFRSEILALIPFTTTKDPCTFVFFKEKIQAIDQTGFEIVNDWLHSFNLDYDHYRELYLSAYTKKNYTIPVSNGRFSLFPLENIQHQTTIWLNPGHIAELKKQLYHTRICLDNGLQVDVTKQIPSLEQQITRAIHCHLLFTPIQSLSSHTIPQPNNLLEYLNLPSTTITRKISRTLPFTLDPKKENAFRLSYFGMTQEYQRILEQKYQK